MFKIKLLLFFLLLLISNNPIRAQASNSNHRSNTEQRQKSPENKKRKQKHNYLVPPAELSDSEVNSEDEANQKREKKPENKKRKLENCEIGTSTGQPARKKPKIEHMQSCSVSTKSLSDSEVNSEDEVFQTLSKDKDEKNFLNAVCRKLSNRSFNVNAKDENGKSILHHIVEYHPNRIQTFLDHCKNNKKNLDLEIKDSQRDTPLFALVREGAASEESPREKCYQKALKLIEHGANVNAQNEEEKNNSVLHYIAVDYTSKELEGFLSKCEGKGLNINIKNDTGETPLHLTLDLVRTKEKPNTKQEYYNKANTLIVHGADLNLKSNIGYTALNWAFFHKDEETILYLFSLRKNNTNCTIPKRNKKTPTDQKDTGREDVTKQPKTPSLAAGVVTTGICVASNLLRKRVYPKNNTT